MSPHTKKKKKKSVKRVSKKRRSGRNARGTKKAFCTVDAQINKKTYPLPAVHHCIASNEKKRGTLGTVNYSTLRCRILFTGVKVARGRSIDHRGSWSISALRSVVKPVSQLESVDSLRPVLQRSTD